VVRDPKGDQASIYERSPPQDGQVGLGFSWGSTLSWQREHQRSVLSWLGVSWVMAVYWTAIDFSTRGGEACQWIVQRCADDSGRLFDTDSHGSDVDCWYQTVVDAGCEKRGVPLYPVVAVYQNNNHQNNMLYQY